MFVLTIVSSKREPLDTVIKGAMGRLNRVSECKPLHLWVAAFRSGYDYLSSVPSECTDVSIAETEAITFGGCKW